MVSTVESINRRHRGCLAIHSYLREQAILAPLGWTFEFPANRSLIADNTLPSCAAGTGLKNIRTAVGLCSVIWYSLHGTTYTQLSSISLTVSDWNGQEIYSYQIDGSVHRW